MGDRTGIPSSLYLQSYFNVLGQFVNSLLAPLLPSPCTEMAQGTNDWHSMFVSFKDLLLLSQGLGTLLLSSQWWSKYLQKQQARR